eukprot:gene6723-7432_t
MAKLLLSFFIALVSLCAVYANVIGIDLASDSLKVAIVQPGTPLEIVTNFQSKRKTPVCVAFYKNERLFGSDASALMGRKPEASFSKFFRMLGRSVDHPAVKEVSSQYFPYNIYRNETSSLTSISVEDEAYTPEELLAMMLQHVKDITANFGGKVIRDCVITVPSSFSQHEKAALYTAAEIADLKVLSLIEENTAAALHYAIDRTFDKPTVVLYYNMGAGSTQVSIVSYSSQTVKEGGKNKTVGQFEVLGKGWDDALGGFYFDLKLADLLAERFNEGWRKKTKDETKDLRNFNRPMTRLRIEANKVKEVLSANNEFPVRAEQLHADVDLNTKVTRSEFEDAAADLFERVVAPIERALEMANLSLQDINEVELLGGGVRMPKIKKLLDDYFKVANLPLGQHLNGDEAMALGAAFRAANLSTAFRVRKVGMNDVSTFGVSIQLDTLPEDAESKKGLFGLFAGKEETPSGETEVWHKHTHLYPVKSALPSKTKTVAFYYDKDIRCKIEYDQGQELFPKDTSDLVAMYNITGVAAFARESAAKGTGQPKVHLSFSLDASGVAELVKAEATFEYEEVVATPTVPAADVNATVDGNETNSTQPEPVEAPANVTVSTKKHVLRRVLTVKHNNNAVYPPRWSQQQIADAKQRLRVLQQADEARKAKAAAMNDLEAYIYKVKNRIYDEEDQLKVVSTEEQRQEVVDLANASEDWLYDEGRDQTVAVYHAKLQELKVKAEAIFHRQREVEARKTAVESALKSLSGVRKQVGGWAEKMPQITEEEKEKLLKLVTAAEEWINERVASQEKQSPFEKPVFESSEVPPQLKPVSELLSKLMKKPKPAPTPVSTEGQNATTSTNGTATAEEVKAEGSSNAEEVKVEMEDKEEPAASESAEEAKTESAPSEEL